jgi:hypothetical protein
MNMVRAAQPDSQFCAAEYKDFESTSPFGYKLDQDVTATIADVQTGINSWVASGGGDTPEAQLNALTQLSGAAWRTGSTRIVVWFGDAPGHDPSNGATLASTIAALQGAGIKVIALSVGADQLDAFGQATAIVSATGGVFMSGIDPSAVTAAILAGLTNLPVTVTMTSDCATTTGGAITTTFVPSSVTVTSGSNATFTETITVAAGAVQGSTYTCSDWALLNGIAMTDPKTGEVIKETKTIHVADVTGPSARCVQGVDPSGNNIPPAGTGSGKSGQNPDGFYQLLGTDNVGVASIVVCDSASAFCSGPFLTGDYVKIVQAPGADPSDSRPGPGVLASSIKLNGDALLKVTDTSGNVTTVQCLVPPPPK